jgi:hypothetical protein
MKLKENIVCVTKSDVDCIFKVRKSHPRVATGIKKNAIIVRENFGKLVRLIIRENFGDLVAVVTTRVFGEENPTPCTLVIVPGSVAMTYRTHYRIISFPYNAIRVQIIIFTSETSRYTNLVQAPWAKRQVEILRSGS